jgi:hypothetical protein
MKYVEFKFLELVGIGKRCKRIIQVNIVHVYKHICTLAIYLFI